MNSPSRSKINWTALMIALVGVGSALGFVPEDHRESVLELTAIIGPMLVAVFRTWFTKP